VEMMGGRIRVDNAEGGGAAFRFTSEFGTAPQTASAPSDGTGPGALGADLSQARVLVIDDNDTSRRWIAALLEHWRCRYDQAPDARSGIEKMKAAVQDEQPYRIVLVDASLPDMDTAEIGAALHGEQGTSDTSVILMSPLLMRRDPAQLQRMGFSAGLTKPVKQSVLEQYLEAACSGKPIRPIAPAEKELTVELPRTPSGARPRILLAEDNAINQAVAVGILRKLGCDVDVVENGLEALRARKSGQYELVLMDCQMPEMDGYEATRGIREWETQDRTDSSAAADQAEPPGTTPVDRIHIVAMTASAMGKDRERCLEAGMDDYIAKPVTPEVMLDILAKWLSQQPESQAHEAPDEARRTDDSFDAKGLLQRLMGDRALAKQIIAAFLDDMPRQIADLRQNAEQPDITAFRNRAHTIKGAAANIGAPSLRELASQAEEASAENTIAQAALLVASIEQHFSELQTVMTAWMDGE